MQRHFCETHCSKNSCIFQSCILMKANLISLDDKRKVHEAVYTHKALNGKLPTAIMRQYKNQQSLVNNRSAENKMLNIPKHKTEQYKNSPLYRTITTWNSIPTEIKKIENTSTFKRKYQAHKIHCFKP